MTRGDDDRVDIWVVQDRVEVGGTVGKAEPLCRGAATHSGGRNDPSAVNARNLCKRREQHTASKVSSANQRQTDLGILDFGFWILDFRPGWGWGQVDAAGEGRGLRVAEQ